MAEKIYKDFDLLIEKETEGYRVRVLNSPMGPATNTVDFPFSNIEIENVILRLGQSRRRVRRIESPEMETAKQFGSRLFNAIFRDDVGNVYRSSLNQINEENQGLRIRIRLSDAPELVDVPWEFLYDASNNRFLNLSVDTPVVRYLDLTGVIKPLLVTPPLRILVMISSPSDYAPLDVEREWERLNNALADLLAQGVLTIDRTDDASLGMLQRQLRRNEYHIFHFIGHGGFDERANDGLLMFEDENGRSKAVSGQTLGMLLHDEKSLRLALLNACEGGRTSAVDPFAGVGQSLLQQGIPAVIAMQFEVTDETAITLAHEFYAALADGYPVDAALAEARKAIFVRNDIEWGTPVLYMRSPDGRIFNVAKLGARQRQAQQIATLWNGAQAAIAEEQWIDAQTKLEEILKLDGKNAKALRALQNVQEKINPPAPQVETVPPQLEKETPPAKVHEVEPASHKRNGIGMFAIAAGLILAGLIGWAVWGNLQKNSPPSQTRAPTVTNTNAVAGLGNFAGTWYSNFSELQLQQTDNKVTGRYQWYGSSEWLDIEGTVNGNTLTGIYQNLDDSKVVLTLTNGIDQFDGYWVNRTNGKQIHWCGVKSGALPSNCGFSGVWQMRGNYTPNSTPIAWIEQNGRDVTGRFENGLGSEGTIRGTIGELGIGTQYSVGGNYKMGNGYTNVFRWDLVDFQDLQFSGCSVNDSGPQMWCGWREGRSEPQCKQPVSCP